jgi:CRISPR-associated endonuclease Csn1
MKKILGLDLGTTSIGWAYVNEAENENEQSNINLLGVRVNPLSTDEQTDFEKGKAIAINADRTLKRGARRNLDRFQLRRESLIKTLQKANIITNETILAENGNNSTFETWRLRSKAVEEKIEKNELARVFLSINKKRGYKSSRKTKSVEDGQEIGQAIDGMEVALYLNQNNLTPGEYCYQLLQKGTKKLPDFYRSDLMAEFDKIWIFQQQFYPEIFNQEFKQELQGKGINATSAIFNKHYQFYPADNKLKGAEKQQQSYKWRSLATKQKLEKEEVAYVIAQINNDLSKSSGYLGAISDRSKELYFNKQTVGQYLYKKLLDSNHAKLKNIVFYRKDYMDEFEKIWETQSKFHPELTTELKNDIRDIIIFFQRPLKSQKSLISYCEFESEEIEKEVDGKIKKIIIGAKVCPKSSPLFQEFKIWQVLNNISFKPKGIKTNKETNDLVLDDPTKELLFEELNLKGNLSISKIFKLLGHNEKEWEVKFKDLEGNHSNKNLYQAYLKIIDNLGYDIKELLKVKTNKDEVTLDDLDVSASSIKSMVKEIFDAHGINTEILEFNPLLEKKDLVHQKSYELWHLLYSYQEDDSESGNEKLYKLLQDKFGFTRDQATVLANVSFLDDYGSLSAKAIRKIFPFIKENKFSTACDLAGFKHSKTSYTKDELVNRVLKPKLDLVKKNSLRNPVVEKILNQMVNVVNTLIDQESKKNQEKGINEAFNFDEIRIELARELKKSAKERAEMTSQVNKGKIEHQKIVEILNKEFGIKNPNKNAIIKYRLYQELKNNGYKDLYTDTYISPDKIFSNEIDIEHIIPQSRLFDDSFSNKTLSYRKDNLKKGNQTAYDYILAEYGEDKLNSFVARVENLYQLGVKNKEEGISKAKYKKLLMQGKDIGDGFIERDLRDSQYIAKKAKEMLFQIAPSVLTTTGSITDRLREDWGLINVMKELNLEKYRALGLVENIVRMDGGTKEVIKDWTKRNDHRHHAMDALTVAFTQHNHIQYLNHLNARKNENNKLHKNIIGIEVAVTELKEEGNSKKRVFKSPIQNFRTVAKQHLENVLISHKAKNKVVTTNKNIFKTKDGVKVQEVKTPRGQLHKETVYGKYHYQVSKMEKISAKFDEETIKKVANPTYRDALLKRLAENNNDPQKAFSGKNSLAKNPIYLNEDKTKLLPESVLLTWLEEDFSIRKDITPENFKDEKSIEKVIDEKIKKLLLNRLKEFSGDAKKAFSDLEKNPIWQNKEKGICIKSTKISGVKNAEPLHYKKNHLGEFILDDKNEKIPVDFVSTGNNHHVAIYEDAEGNLQEKVVSLFEAIAKVNEGLPIIDKTYKQTEGWKFLFTMKSNEFFVFPNENTGFDPNGIDLLDIDNYKEISANLFRVQKIATKNYFFRHHLETKVEEYKELKGVTYKPQLGLNGIKGIVKVRLNHLGQIVQVGEYN